MSFSFRHSILAKVLGILALVVLLQLPLSLIKDLNNERAARRDEAVANIVSTWGGPQQLAGPFLVVPTRGVATSARETVVAGRAVQTTETRPVGGFAVFLPEQLRIEGELEPERRAYGIYETVVWRARLRVSGAFAPADFAALGAAAGDFDWNRAYLAFGVDDLRGAREAITLDWNGESRVAEPGARHRLLPTGVHVLLPSLASAVEAGAPLGEFSVELALNGSGRLSVVPVGGQTSVTLRSPWTDPSFTGAQLPATRDLRPDGFTATWQSSYYGREFPRQWGGDERGAPASPESLAKGAFGVELVTLVDSYRVVERASKYGILFVALLFTAFFLFEVLAALRLHPLHYGLVGAALVLFYLALLSLSEFVDFNLAYVVAALASTLLITLYSGSILRSGRRSLVIGGALAGIYGFLFFVLRMQDYALLAGTAALFAVLGFVMYATRKIDWSGEDEEASGVSPSADISGESGSNQPPPLPGR